MRISWLVDVSSGLSLIVGVTTKPVNVPQSLQPKNNQWPLEAIGGLLDLAFVDDAQLRGSFAEAVVGSSPMPQLRLLRTASTQTWILLAANKYWRANNVSIQWRQISSVDLQSSNNCQPWYIHLPSNGDRAAERLSTRRSQRGHHPAKLQPGVASDLEIQSWKPLD